MSSSINIANVKICHLEYSDIINEIKEKIIKNQKYFIVAINSKKVVLANQDEELRKILNEADCQTADGFGILLGAKFLGKKINKRITGVDLFLEICRTDLLKNKNVFLYGSTDVILKKTEKELLKYENIKIVGSCNGYDYKDEEVIERINNSSSTIVFVAKGSPHQERWISKNMHKINSNVFMGVGGSFDVVSGSIKRAPRLVQKVGLEWLYRIIKQPKRIKDVIFLWQYIVLVIKNRFKKNRRVST